MAPIHRALFSWFMFLVFVILLVLRLDDKAIWNWFIIFIPMWIFDSIILVYIMFYMITHCKIHYDRNDMTMARKVWFLVAMIFKLAFQILICISLEYGRNLALYYVMIPAWLLMIVICADVTRSLNCWTGGWFKNDQVQWCDSTKHGWVGCDQVQWCDSVTLGVTRS